VNGNCPVTLNISTAEGTDTVTGAKSAVVLPSVLMTLTKSRKQKTVINIVVVAMRNYLLMNGISIMVAKMKTG
jgi:hypothetical protein